MFNDISFFSDLSMAGQMMPIDILLHAIQENISFEGEAGVTPIQEYDNGGETVQFFRYAKDRSTSRLLQIM